MSSTIYSEIMRLNNPPGSLLGYWPLADAVGSATAKDVSGNGRDGTVHGGVTFGQASLLKASTLSSALYNGSTGYLSVPYNAALNPATFTLLAWISSAGFSNYQAIISSRNTSPHTGYILYVDPGGKIEFWTGNNGTGFVTLTGATTLSTNHVYFVGATYDGTTARIYLNGTQDASAAQGYVAQTANELRIGAGANEGAAQFFFSGRQAQPVILSGALSPDQITRLYNVGQGAEGIVRGSHRSFGRVM